MRAALAAVGALGVVGTVSTLPGAVSIHEVYNRAPYIARRPWERQQDAVAAPVRDDASCIPPVYSDPNYVGYTDASGHRTADIGNYDECLQVPTAQHCVMYFSSIPIGMCPPRNCTTADLTDPTSPIFTRFVGVMAPIVWSAVLAGYPVYAACGDHSVPLTQGAVAVIAVMAIWGAVMAAATLMKWPQVNGVCRRGKAEEDKSRSLALQLLDCFSLTRSVPALLRTTPAGRAMQTSPLNGVRVLSMSMIILGHTVFFMQSPGLINMNFFLPAPTGVAQWDFQVIPSAEFAVDTFFTMSGFLCAYLLIKELAKFYGWRYAEEHATDAAADSLESGLDGRPLLSLNGVSDAVRPTRGPLFPPTARSKLLSTMTYYIVHRLWRLMPLLGFAIAFYTNVLPSLSFGPFWFYINGGPQLCADWWWSTLLFVNDYVPVNDNFGNQCMGWTWYLGLDMQLYLLTPLAVGVFVWNARAGWALLTATLVALLVACEEIVRQNDLTVMLYVSGTPRETGDYSNLFYTKLWTRAPSYVLGVGLAFLLYQRDVANAAATSKLPIVSSSEEEAEDDEHMNGGTGVNWSTIANYALLFASLAVMAVIFYVPTDYYQDVNGRWSHTGVIIYTAFSRSIWSLGLCGMLWACFVLPDSLLSRFLSLPLWEPLARVTYGAYIAHPMVMEVVYYSAVTLFHYDPFTMTSHYIANAALAYGVAALLFICIEYPLGALEKTVMTYWAGGSRHAAEGKSLRV